MKTEFVTREDAYSIAVEVMEIALRDCDMGYACQVLSERLDEVTKLLDE